MVLDEEHNLEGYPPTPALPDLEPLIEQNKEVAIKPVKHEVPKKGFNVGIAKLPVHKMNIEDLNIKTLILPEYIGQDLGFKPIRTSSNSTKKIDMANNIIPIREAETESDTGESNPNSTLNFRKRYVLGVFHRKVRLTVRSFNLVSRLFTRNIKSSGRKPLSLYRSSPGNFNQEIGDKWKLKKFHLKHNIGKPWKKKNFRFINSSQQISSAVPIQSAPTIICEHSKSNLDRIKDLRVDGKL